MCFKIFELKYFASGKLGNFTSIGSYLVLSAVYICICTTHSFFQQFEHRFCITDEQICVRESCFHLVKVIFCFTSECGIFSLFYCYFVHSYFKAFPMTVHNLSCLAAVNSHKRMQERRSHQAFVFLL